MKLKNLNFSFNFKVTQDQIKLDPIYGFLFVF